MSSTYNSVNLRAIDNAQHPVSKAESTKNQRRQNVTVHNIMTATPTEDWTLYPDEVVVTKHSSIKEARRNSQKSHSNSKVCSVRMTRPEMPPTPPGSNPASSKDRSSPERSDACTRKDSQSMHGRPTSEASFLAAMTDRTTRRRVSYPHRLPTPDISDVDEDEFWACCKDGYVKK